jgi:acyl carrier protein
MIMDRKAILEELKKVLAPYIKNKELLAGINEQTNLVTDLKINSANLVDIVIDAESKYHIEIDVDSAEKMVTVSNCLDVIQEKLAQTSQP